MSRDEYEANWNGLTDRQTDGQDNVLCQADAALTKNCGWGKSVICDFVGFCVCVWSANF